MTIMGAIQDGLGQGYTILLTKSSLDFIASIILAASLGVHWDKELVWKGAGIPFGEKAARPPGQRYRHRPRRDR